MAKRSDLPKGVALRNGQIGGRPKAAGVFTFAVEIKSSADSATNIYQLKVVP